MMAAFLLLLCNLIIVCLLLEASLHVYAINATICPGYGSVVNSGPEQPDKSDEVSSFQVKFQTDVIINGSLADPFVIEVYRDWAPNSADRFRLLVEDGYYNGATFFRVVPSFVVEFGIAATPCESEKWFTNVPADPVNVHNDLWTVSFAADFNATSMTKFTTQLFINYANNTRLDAKGFAPFGVVVSGFDTLTNLLNPTPNSTDGVDQKPIYENGNTWVYDNYYPNISAITKADLMLLFNNDNIAVSKKSTEWADILAIVVISIMGGSLLFCVCRFDYVKDKCFKDKRGMRDLAQDEEIEERY